jgi:cytochrome c oxidase subunit 3
MPVTTKYPRGGVREQTPGHGGRPPELPHKTGGGGDGDNWKDERQGHRGPREHLNRWRLMMAVGIGSDLIFFLVLAAIFFSTKSNMHLNERTLSFISDWHPIQLPRLLWANTVVLALSCVTMELARRHIFFELDVIEEWLGLGRPAARRTIPWLGATVALGALFLLGQVMVWMQLAAQGFVFLGNPTPASYCFFLMTGLHALHLLVGIGALMACLCGLIFLKKMETRQILVDSTAWYWHAMGLCWISLFLILEYAQ